MKNRATINDNLQFSILIYFFFINNDLFDSRLFFFLFFLNFNVVVAKKIELNVNQIAADRILILGYG